MVKVWKDANGRWIDAKEFKERFSKGVQQVTPLQQVNSQVLFSWITIIGIVCGMVVCIINAKTLWWLGIILVAALGNSAVGLIGLYQRKIQLDNIQKMIEGDGK